MMADNISADKLREQKDDFVIIDVREPDKISGRQIDGSMNIPLGLVIHNARQGKLDHLKDKKIIYHCSSGYRGNIAAEELGKCGFQVANLEGGFEAYKKLNMQSD